MLGASAPHLAEQYVGQMEMFFGALAWYLDQHPEQAEVMLKGIAHAPEAGKVGEAPGAGK